MYDEEEKINEYALTLFVKDEDERYEKYEEFHYQRAYEIEEMKEMIQASGLELLAVYDAFTKEAPRPESDRVYFIARECGKEAE